MEDSPLDVFPDEIKVNIFCRLPIESLLDCKLTISFVGFDKYQPRDLWYLEYYDYDDRISTEKRPNYCMRKMNLELPVGVGGLAGSDNGLICLAAKTKYEGIPIPGSISGRYIFFTYTANEPLYICNPVTREFMNLPGILLDEKKSINGVFIVHGFGYHPKTNEYKVVRISYVGIPGNPSFELKGRVEVYTLGGSGRRNAGETNYFLWSNRLYSGDPAGFCVNGAIHWKCNESTDIVVFDLADEEFHLLRSPITRLPIIGLSRRKLIVMRGCLCLEYWYSPSLEMELWVLKKNKEENSSSSSDHMNEQYYYKSWSWSREFILSSVGNRWDILCLLKSGEILLNDDRKVVRCTSNEGPISSTKIMEHNNMFDYWDASHINSFVSLDALGERNVQKFVAQRSQMTIQEPLDADRPVSPARLSNTK
ncbi:hypothetical protein MKW98_009748 [Papaver atlanticum]|uniref:F-box associated beta-propeller type 3 domain-containing protein n=1 Tax=Papaver atlanticum TaxID=357466 RepID=A0AAD4SX16_9MAGN|nr:hypothetical protein MKW98_009748 [Papaver atlanticum]